VTRSLAPVLTESKAYHSLAEQTLYNPALTDMLEPNNIRMDTSALEEKMNIMIEEMRDFSGRIHIVESEVGIASNRYNNKQTKRNMTR
jgi:hypothetical protein